MGPRFLSFASAVDGFATVVGVLVSIISAEVNAPAPAPGSQTSHTQDRAPASSDRPDGSELTAQKMEATDDGQLLGNGR